MLFLIGALTLACACLLGTTHRDRVAAPAVGAYAAGVLLMYTVVRAGFFISVGTRPTALVVTSTAVIASAYLIGRQGIQMASLSGLALGGSAFLVSFRSGWESVSAQNALTLALPALLLGLLLARAPISALSRGLMVLGLLLLVEFIVAPSSGQSRFALPEENPIWSARAMGFVALGIAVSQLRLSWRVLLVSTVLVLMFATGSRGPIWATLLALAFFVRSGRRGASKTLMSVLMAASALGVVGLVGIERFTTLGIERDESVTAREELWADGLARWWAQPIFGSGRAFSEDGIEFYTHNSVIELLIQGGLAAAVPFLVIFLVGLRRAWFGSPPLAAFLIAAAAMSFVSGSVWVNLELWLLSAWAFVIPSRVAENKAEGSTAQTGQDRTP